MADSALTRDYPWIETPLIACAPMRLIALDSLAIAVSKAGGLGFIGAGNDVSGLGTLLEKVSAQTTDLARIGGSLPIGVGFLLWAGDKLLGESLPILQQYKPSAVWLFAPSNGEQTIKWTKEVRRVTGGVSKIWVQIGTVTEAVDVVRTCRPDVLVVQGSDAGGHGLQHCAGLISLLPEVDDTVSAICEQEAIPKPSLIATGGIMDGRGTAAAILLGASGVTLGTRYLAAPESNIASGYRDAVLDATDGGISTQRGHLYDTLRGTTSWPADYGGRGVLNASWYDSANGLSVEENKRLYDEAMERGDAGWGRDGRLTTYAGTGVGLVKEMKDASTITKEVRDAARVLLGQPRQR